MSIVLGKKIFIQPLICNFLNEIAENSFFQKNFF